MLRSKTVLFYILLILKSSLGLPIQLANNRFQLLVPDQHHESTSNPVQDLSFPSSNLSGGIFDQYSLSTVEPLQVTTLTSCNCSESSTFSSYLYQYRWWGLVIVPIVLVTAVYSVPALLGFGAAGIGAGTTAAGMMSAAAVSGGGAIAAGSTVAVLQSVGVLGVSSLGVSLTAGLVTAGGLAGYGLGYAMEKIINPLSKLSRSAFNDTKIFAEKYAIIISNGTVEAWNSVANWAKGVDIENVFVQFKNGSIDTWNSFNKLTTAAEIDSAVLQFKNITVETWNSFTNWTKNVDVNSVLIETKNGTVDAWNSVVDWTETSNENIKNGTIDAWNSVVKWTETSNENIKNGTIDAWGSVVDWTKTASENVKTGSTDAWNSVTNFFSGSNSSASLLKPNILVIISITLYFISELDSLDLNNLKFM